MPDLWLIFTTGLLAGGLTCMAVQGGLLTTLVAQRQQAGGSGLGGSSFPVILFLLSKLVAYTILGAILGHVGLFFQLSTTLSAALLVVVAIFMIGTALALLEVHPLFRYFILAPPRFLTRIVRDQTKSSAFFAPASLGAMTLLIPCGTTQAMMALALASGSPVFGAAVMATFVLGTSPLFFALGVAMTKLGEAFDQKFRKAAAYIVIVLALWNLNGAMALFSSSFTFQNIATNIYCTVAFCNLPAVSGASTPASVATIEILSSSYKLDNPVLKAGAPITLNLKNSSGYGCTQVFAIPKLAIRKVIPVGRTETITFTAPKEPGKLAFTCSMGMFGGSFEVRS